MAEPYLEELRQCLPTPDPMVLALRLARSTLYQLSGIGPAVDMAKGIADRASTTWRNARADGRNVAVASYQVAGVLFYDAIGAMGIWRWWTGEDPVTLRQYSKWEARAEGARGLVQLALTALGGAEGLHAARAALAGRAAALAPRSGGRAWTWGYGKIGDRAAEGAYQAIRESTTDVAAISRYTKLKAGRLQKIKDYLFNNPQWTGADGEIAAAWHRLRTGRGTEVDKLLLKHETAEMWLQRVKGLSQEKAHRLARLKYDWQKIIEGTLD